MKEKIHTGCSCRLCKLGKTKKVRRNYHRKNRLRMKKELQKKGEVINPNFSIGYTD